jgi:hypothetical protein
VTALNRSLSRVAPRVYPLFFVPADVSCLVVQAIGGGIAASAGYNNYKLLQNGNRTIIAGVALQVVVLGAFGLMAGDYLFRARRYFRQPAAVAPEFRSGAALWADRKFKMFLWAMGAAYALLLIRCIYRIAEMAGGWGSPIMQDEPVSFAPRNPRNAPVKSEAKLRLVSQSFIALESFMVVIACALLAAFPPGIFFPQMSHKFVPIEEEKQPQTESDSAGFEMGRV